MKKRNPIARVVTRIKPKIVPDKRKKRLRELHETEAYQPWRKLENGNWD